MEMESKAFANYIVSILIDYFLAAYGWGGGNFNLQCVSGVKVMARWQEGKGKIKVGQVFT